MGEIRKASSSTAKSKPSNQNNHQEPNRINRSSHKKSQGSRGPDHFQHEKAASNNGQKTAANDKSKAANNTEKPKQQKNEAAAMENHGAGAHGGHTTTPVNNGPIVSSSESFLKAGNSTGGTNATQSNNTMDHSMPGMDHSKMLMGDMVGTASGQTVPSIFNPPEQLLKDPGSKATAQQLGPFFDNIAPIMGYKQDELQNYDKLVDITHQNVPVNATQTDSWKQAVQKQFNDLYLPVHADYAHNYGTVWMDGAVHPEWNRIETTLKDTAGIVYQPPEVTPEPLHVEEPLQSQPTIQDVSMHGQHSH